ncbi:MAG: DNA internalization-related competence protein ComEC/Rec2 [Eubacteriales bacterium]|nr:DNA internalization-related competence protein ComEC/Rec2 [Eubacteriales bacterium]
MRRRPLVIGFLLMVFSIWVGEACGWLVKVQPPPAELEGEEIILSGTIYRRETKSEKFLIYLKDISIESENLPSSTKGILYTTEKNGCRIGSQIKAKGICYFPQPASNPGQFDQKTYYQAKQISFFLQKAEILEATDFYSHTKEALTSFREILKGRLTAALESLGETRDSGVLAAMLLGDQTLLEEDTRSLFQSGGISHILAISGLHTSIIGMAVYGLLRAILGGFALPAAVSGAFMIFYGWFTGGSVSTMRAVVMFLIYLGAQVRGRDYDRWSAWAFGGILMLLREPLQLFQCGFQLTMLSVAGIEFSHNLSRKAPASIKFSRKAPASTKHSRNPLASLKHSQKAPVSTKLSRIWNKLSPGLLLQAFTLPCTLYWFYELPLYGLFLNLFILPLMPAVLLSSAAGMLAALISAAAGQFLLSPAHYILSFSEFLCALSEKLPCGKLLCGAPHPIAILLYYIGLISLLTLPRRLGHRPKITLKIASTLLTAASILCFLYPALTNGGNLQKDLPYLLTDAPGELQLTFLDVGQGDCIFIRSPEGVTWLIDGGSSTETSVGKYRIQPFLKQQGISRLNYLIATHMDADHINGIRELLQNPDNLTIQNLILHETALQDEQGQTLQTLAAASNIPVTYLSQNQGFACKSLRLTCLWPPQSSPVADKNQNSLVFQLTYGTFTALLTGDLEKEAETALLASGLLTPAWLLKAGHHGSKNASSTAFLTALQPALTILSYGQNNRYGHPSPETLSRLAAIHTQILSTATSGAITLRTTGTSATLETYLP